jgi:hypothetical protein
MESDCFWYEGSFYSDRYPRIDLVPVSQFYEDTKKILKTADLHTLNGWIL